MFPLLDIWRDEGHGALTARYGELIEIRFGVPDVDVLADNEGDQYQNDQSEHLRGCIGRLIAER